MLGSFLAIDLFAFYVFWELMLIRCTSSSASGRRAAALRAIKFVIFTLVGSLLMLAAILYLYAQVHASWSMDLRLRYLGHHHLAAWA